MDKRFVRPGVLATAKRLHLSDVCTPSVLHEPVALGLASFLATWIVPKHMMFTDQRTVVGSAAVVVKRMWEGGPLREVSSTPRVAWFAHSRYGFAGRYVCDGCLLPVPGIYGSRSGSKCCVRAAGNEIGADVERGLR